MSVGKPVHGRKIKHGGGRRKASDSIDPAVGLTELAGLGAALQPGDPLALIHPRDPATAEAAAARLLAAYAFADAAAAPRPVVIERIAA